MTEDTMAKIKAGTYDVREQHEAWSAQLEHVRELYSEYKALQAQLGETVCIKAA